MLCAMCVVSVTERPAPSCRGLLPVLDLYLGPIRPPTALTVLDSFSDHGHCVSCRSTWTTERRTDRLAEESCLSWTIEASSCQSDRPIKKRPSYWNDRPMCYVVLTFLLVCMLDVVLVGILVCCHVRKATTSFRTSVTAVCFLYVPVLQYVVTMCSV